MDNINKEEQEVNTDEMSVDSPNDEMTEQQSDTNVDIQDEAIDPLKAAEAQVADLKDKYLRQGKDHHCPTPHN